MDEPIDRKVQCSNCGFLAKFDTHYSGPPPYIYEMPPEDRGSGDMSTIHLAAKEVGHCSPRCYMGVIDMGKQMEVAINREGKQRGVAARELFQAERSCTKWHPYTPGLSPQEHLQETRMLELELKRQEFEERMEADRKSWQQGSEDSRKDFDLKLFRQGQEFNERSQKVNFRLTIVLGIFTVVEVVATVLPLAYPNGLPWLMK